MTKAATPSRTFCDDFTITAVFAAVSPISVPEAATAPVVSIVPPSHAPATSSLSPMRLASHGRRYIIGMAIMSTSEITYESFLLSPLMTPQVAMAADTPQMDTAEESIVLISGSTFIFFPTQNAKYHTENTTIRDCASPNAPDSSTSLKRIVEPRQMMPILM